MRNVGTVIAAVAVGMLVFAACGGAQTGRTRVEYDVEFSTEGPLLDPNCTATGTDVLTGTLVGEEPPLPDEPNEYVGTLMRSTRITTCGEREGRPGEYVVCSISYEGVGFPDVILTIEPGQREGYLQYLDNRAQWASLYLPPPPPGQAYSTVTGTCDPAELAELQADYDTGETAGSPNGQPIEVPALPPPGYPFMFAAKPPQSIWTLKVLARRP